MGSSCASRLCSDDDSDQQNVSRQSITRKNVMIRSEAECSHSQQRCRSLSSPTTNSSGKGDVLQQPPRDASQITDEEKNSPHVEQHTTSRRSIVAPVKGMLFTLVPSCSSPLHHNEEHGALQVDASDASLSKEVRHQSADKSSEASMAAVYGYHPLGPLAVDAFDSTHASRRHSLDSSLDNHPAATRSTYSLNSNDIQSKEGDSRSSSHRPWPSVGAAAGDEQRRSSSLTVDHHKLRLPRFLL